MFRVLSEVLLIIFAAIGGAYIWNHGRNIFNRNYDIPNLSLWGAIMLDIKKYRKAWIAFSLVLIALISVIGWRIWLDQRESNDEIQRLIESNQEWMESTQEQISQLIDKIDALLEEIRYSDNISR